jgi:hypothetical protein
LLEPQSTNLITDSEDFSDFINFRTSKAPSSVISPDGVSTVIKITDDLTNQAHYIYKQNVSTLSSGYTTISAYVKSAENNGFAIQVYDGASTVVNTAMNYDLTNKTISGGGGSGVTDSYGELIEFNDGWFRAVYTIQTAALENAQIRFHNRSSTGFTLGNGVDGIYIWGAQLEALPYATSYIPTSGGIATRSAEILERDNISHLINSEEGVLYVEMKPLNEIATNNYISISDSTPNNYLYIGFSQNSSNIIRISFSINGTIQTNFISVTNRNINSSYALKWDNNSFYFYKDGVLITTEVLTGVFDENVLNSIKSSHYNGTSNPFHGNIKDLRIYKSIAEAQKDLTYIN